VVGADAAWGPTATVAITAGKPAALHFDLLDAPGADSPGVGVSAGCATAPLALPVVSSPSLVVSAFTQAYDSRHTRQQHAWRDRCAL